LRAWWSWEEGVGQRWRVAKQFRELGLWTIWTTPGSVLNRNAIFAGCIPVLIAEGSHYPFASMLDWSIFSVRVHPTQLDQIEAILGVIPLARVEEMQANLMLIRDAFIYAIDEWPQDELTEKGTDVLGAAWGGIKVADEMARWSWQIMRRGVDNLGDMCKAVIRSQRGRWPPTVHVSVISLLDEI